MLTEANNNKYTPRFDLIISKIDSLREAIIISNESIDDECEGESKRLIFRLRAKWAEKGEKSNKYFFNLIKHNKAKTIVTKMSVGQKNLSQAGQYQSKHS